MEAVDDDILVDVRGRIMVLLDPWRRATKRQRALATMIIVGRKRMDVEVHGGSHVPTKRKGEIRLSAGALGLSGDSKVDWMLQCAMAEAESVHNGCKDRLF